MGRSGITSERLIFLFLLGLLLFNPPLLSIFDRPATVIGIPLLYIYLFAAWGVLVVLMALTVESAAAAEEGAERGAEGPAEVTAEGPAEGSAEEGGG
jgi:hypothetical protein